MTIIETIWNVIIFLLGQIGEIWEWLTTPIGENLEIAGLLHDLHLDSLNIPPIMLIFSSTFIITIILVKIFKGVF